MSRTQIILGISALVLLVCASAYAYYLFRMPPAAPAPAVQNEVQPAPAPETPQKPAHEVIGTSVEGRPIDAYTYGSEGSSTDIMFVGGMHGGYEWNSVLLAYDFMDYLASTSDAIPKGIRITVIPSANPDGVYAVIKKEGRFTLADALQIADPSGLGRFNADKVDLNRNFDCNWKPTSTWQSKTVSAGTAAFSEPEAQAIKYAVSKYRPSAVVFWHSQANAVYASECHNGVLPATIDVMNAYAKAAGYPAVPSFDAYPITGDAEGWLASINIPAITVEMKTHATVEWDKNLLGIKALIAYFQKRDDVARASISN